MKILDELNIIKEQIEELSLGEIMRGTRDILGMKQWKLADFLRLNVSQMKTLESNAYRDEPDERAVELFCELFGYDFQKVWKQAKNRVVQHKKSMQIFSKHPYYVKRLEEDNQGMKNVLENVKIKPNNSRICS